MNAATWRGAVRAALALGVLASSLGVLGLLFGVFSTCSSVVMLVAGTLALALAASLFAARQLLLAEARWDVLPARSEQSPRFPWPRYVFAVLLLASIGVIAGMLELPNVVTFAIAAVVAVIMITIEISFAFNALKRSNQGKPTRRT